jgi:hypothetical protein
LEKQASASVTAVDSAQAVFSVQVAMTQPLVGFTRVMFPWPFTMPFVILTDQPGREGNHQTHDTS